jgi:small glutamine-rich tetratricopeptide repeat-containing protein alpha
MDKENQKYLAYAILDFLNSCKKDAGEETDESVSVAMECISDAFKISYEKDSTKYSMAPTNLYDIFSVFVEKKKALKKEAELERAKKAEQFKAKGNEKLNAKEYAEAIKLYSEAIKIDPNNAVYYCNR